MLGTIQRLSATPDPIRFVLQSGDAVQNGSIGAQLRVSYEPLINRLTREGGVSYFLSVGNHDVGSAKDLDDRRRATGLANYFAANARLIPAEGSPRRLAGYPTYAFGYGNTFFIAFDSNIPEDSVQFDWVKRQLESLDRRRYVNVAVFFHHPPFSSGPHRIDEIVSGGGGAPLYAYTGEPDLAAYEAQAHATLTHLARPSSDPGGNPFHYVVVHVDGENISLEVIGVDWGKGFSPYRTNAVSIGLRAENVYFADTLAAPRR